MTATGKLGDVMRESVQAAESYVKSRSIAFGIAPTMFDRKDIHVHVPEGATPKDGPSARRRHADLDRLGADRHRGAARDVAMTGEITLSGRILPIGGLKEKLLAALRGGLSKPVLIPKENEKDLGPRIPDNVKRGLYHHPGRDDGRVALQRPRARQARSDATIEWTDDEPCPRRCLPAEGFRPKVCHEGRPGIVNALIACLNARRRTCATAVTLCRQG